MRLVLPDKKRGRAIAIIALLCALATPMFAALTGDIEGTVFYRTGAVMTGAKVSVKNLSSGATRGVDTNQFGQFSAPQPELGTYEIKVEKDGFKTSSYPAVVRSGEKPRIDATLQVGKKEDSILVEAGA